MKQTIAILFLMGLSAFVLAQQPAGSQNPPAQAQPGAAATTATPPAGKRQPAAKTQPEYDAYKAAMSAGNDPATLEKTADDFSTKYPDSELRVLLYKNAMHAYQSANNADKMMEMGRKVLKVDPDDPEALIGVAEVLAERTRDTDLDKDQRLAEAQKFAQHALETIDTDVAVPPGTPQEKIDAYKGFMRSTAYSILGALAFNKEQFPEAEGYFRKSIDALPSQPDPIVVLRLAICLDKQNKYPEALKEANRAVELTQDGTAAGNLARRERDRLVAMTGGNNTAAPAPPKN